MRKELKTLGKRIAASALAIATAFVLIPFGGKAAKATTYISDANEEYGSIVVYTDGTVDSTGEGSVWEDEDAVCGFYGSVSFDSVTVDASAKTITFKNLNCASELSTCTTGWTFIFDGTCETVIVLEEGTATIQVTAGSTLTCPKIFAPSGISLGENTVMSPEDADVTDGMNAPSVVFSSAAPSTHTVTFETNDGSKVEALEVEDGAKATKPTDPTKEGYTFDGWYSDKDLTKAFDFATAITADTTVYAKWTEDKKEEDKKEDDSAKASTDDGEVTKESPADNAMPTVVSNSVEELKTVLLEDADIAALEAGEDIKVYFAVTDIASTVNATEKTKVEEATKAVSTDYSIGAYLDIDLFKQVGDKAAAGVTSTKGKMKVTVTLPESLRGDYTYKAVRLHDGTATVLDATYDKTTGNLTFESDQFSTYAIIYKKAEAATTTEATTAAAAAATTTEATTAAKSSPKTGDSALPFVAFAILGLSALAGAYSLKKFAK